jgi:cytochrome c biogenesis protein CcmG, thiol:disulfide interchange protein DsbE
MRLLKYFVPLGLFFGLCIFLYLGLSKDPREIPSPLIGKAAPTFALPVLTGELVSQSNITSPTPKTVWEPSAMLGKVWLLNVWGSWCAGCLTEHPILLSMSKTTNSPKLIGIAWKDEPAASSAWLKKNGNPFEEVVVDRAGKVAIDYGVYGAPETFLIDKKGIIRAKHIGPLTEQAWTTRLQPLAAKLALE